MSEIMNSQFETKALKPMNLFMKPNDDWTARAFISKIKLMAINSEFEALFIIISLAYIILAMHLPVSIYTGAMADDALFWGNAKQILSGNWLGTYNQMTLAKGPGFPLFLAVNYVLGIPITLLIALLYLFACWLTANTLRVLGLNKYFALTIFVVILFHPALFPLRIIRDNIYPALALITVSGVVRLVFQRTQQNQWLLSVILYGSFFGLFWVTREEGIWIIPGLLLLFLAKSFHLRKQNLPVKDVILKFTSFSLVAILFVSLIAMINYYNYGKFEVVDFKGQAFSQAFRSLDNVDVGPELPYLPVSFEKRQAIYRISPTFSQLRDYFEDKGKGWTSHGCQLFPWTCGDYAAGWFMWAFRDAVATRGYYDSPVRAAEFYNNITKEIESACDSGLIRCRRNPIPLMPNITLNQLAELPAKTVQAVKLAMVQTPVPAFGSSTEPLIQLQKTRLFLGQPLTTLAPSEQRVNFSGWFYKKNLDWIAVDCLVSGNKVTRSIDRVSGPDVAVAVNDSKAHSRRFSISVPANEDCSIHEESLSLNGLPIKTLLEKKGGGFDLSETGHLHIDYIFQTMDNPAQDFFVRLKNSLTNLYKFFVPILVLMGILTYATNLVFICMRKVSITNLFIISTAMWCLFFSRIILLVFVEISSFSAIDILYMSAAFPILCVAALLSLEFVSAQRMKSWIFERIFKHSH